MPLLRNATALATSLALVVPTVPAFAQSDRAAARQEAREACRAEGLRGRDEVRPCILQRLADQGFDVNEAEAEAEAAVEELVEESEAVVEDVVEAPVEEAPVVEEVVEAPAEAEPVEEVAETPTEEVIEEIVEEGGDGVADVAEEVQVPEAVEEAPAVEAVEAAPEAPEAPVEAETASEADVDQPVAIEGEAVETQQGDGAEALREALETEAAPAEAAEAEEGAPTEEVAEEAADLTPREQRRAERQATRQAAREACRADGLRGDARRACVAETLGLDAGEAAPESELAEEIAAEPEPELTEEEEAAAVQAEAALTALEASTGDATSEEAVPTAAAAAGDAAPEAEVSEEVVTAEDVRTSDQDFETSAIARERDSGLSNREKFALGALGLLAVGTVLNNRSRVVSNSGDRVVVQRDDGNLQVLKDDDALLRTEGDRVRTEQFSDGSTRTIVTREDGSQVITVRDASLRVLRRVLVRTDGTEVTLIDDTAPIAPVEVATLPPAPSPIVSTREGDALGDALRAELGQTAVDRAFSLAQIRQISEVRQLAPAFEVNAITFDSGSAAIRPEQAANLADLGRQLVAAIRENPAEVFLIEGHTDAVGDAAYNLALSDRRAESLALALNEYFDVPVENMVVQGYGEQFLKVQTLSDERANRRAVVREITDLLRVAAAN
ncbi:OmpA family protein [Jannaschia sp. Os4]|uniref:OmpA family protein n=1 Tax=Jannaschia sp. Os4 TaxID=2807617 RepID=UPI00193A29F1|nr:OmpA family protein [Jannaschia sp. Os4]MBM2577668.1 OmpA family protein [Jannaschia sp. Os4]